MSRVLGRIRLSRLTEESTSEGRQREIVERWAEAGSHEIVGWATDLDVSGSVDPFETPGLGPWLAEDKRDDWDCVVAWKLDRFGRDAIRLNKLFGWCADHGKTLVSASEGIDLSTAVGRLIANVIAFLAEGELAAIKERTKASRAALLSLGRWPGGIAPYGLRPVEHPDGGWRLGIDPEQSKIVLRIVQEMIDGSASEAVANRLNEDGVPAPRGGMWHRITVYRIVRSKYLMGHATYDGETVRNREGLPVLNAEPLLTGERFDQLQAAVDLRQLPTPMRTAKTSPLLGVVACLDCGRDLTLRTYYRNTGKRVYRYYHCPNGHGPQIVAETIEELVEEAFLYELEHDKVRERVYVPAESHQTELDEAVRAVDELTALAGTMTSDTLRKRLSVQLSALDSRIAELEQLPARESRWEYRDGEETYGEAWKEADVQGKRQLLLRSGITAVVKLSGKTRSTPGVLEFHLRIPHDLRKRLSV